MSVLFLWMSAACAVQEIIPINQWLDERDWHDAIVNDWFDAREKEKSEFFVRNFGSKKMIENYQNVQNMTSVMMDQVLGNVKRIDMQLDVTKKNKRKVVPFDHAWLSLVMRVAGLPAGVLENVFMQMDPAFAEKVVQGGKEVRYVDHFLRNGSIKDQLCWYSCVNKKMGDCTYIGFSKEKSFLGNKFVESTFIDMFALVRCWDTSDAFIGGWHRAITKA